MWNVIQYRDSPVTFMAMIHLDPSFQLCLFISLQQSEVQMYKVHCTQCLH